MIIGFFVEAIFLIKGIFVIFSQVLIIKLRKLGVTNHKVLSILEKIPRENFIDKELSYKAYLNNALPIDCNQTISQPAVVAKMTELLEPKKSINVLEIGTGSGYQTAILSKLFKRIYSIERHKKLLDRAKEVLSKLKINNNVFQINIYRRLFLLFYYQV